MLYSNAILKYKSLNTFTEPQGGLWLKAPILSLAQELLTPGKAHNSS